jgi:hypothetical protein
LPVWPIPDFLLPNQFVFGYNSGFDHRRDNRLGAVSSGRSLLRSLTFEEYFARVLRTPICKPSP